MQLGGLQPEARDRFALDIEALRDGARVRRRRRLRAVPAAGDACSTISRDDTLLVLDEPADITAVQIERDEQAREARRELELRHELPTGMPEPHVRGQTFSRDRVTAARSDSHAGRRARRDAPGAGAAVRLPVRPGRRIRRTPARAGGRAGADPADAGSR